MISWALSNTVPPAHDHMVHTPRDPLGRLLRILALRPATEGHTPVSMTPITAHKARTTADMDLTKSAEEGPQRPHVWVVRANGGKYTDHFVTGGYAAVGMGGDRALLGQQPRRSPSPLPRGVP